MRRKMPLPARHSQLERLINFPNVRLLAHTPSSKTEGVAEILVTSGLDTTESMDMVLIAD